MTRPRLREANREVLDAIATPPDTGVEGDLDRIASHIYFLAEEKPMAPDHGRLSLLRYKLRELENRAHGDRVVGIRRARELLADFQRNRRTETRATTEG
jgi:hypothetical protein